MARQIRAFDRLPNKLLTDSTIAELSLVILDNQRFLNKVITALALDARLVLNRYISVWLTETLIDIQQRLDTVASK